MVILGPLVQVIASALLVSAATPTKTVTKRASGSSDAVTPFVTTSQDGQFMFNGSALNFVGTNAYWLSTLNSDDDIDFTLGNMSAAGIKVVRTWGFNDVETIPENGTWFQLIANGTTTVNEGPNGLQKLDTVIRMAEKHGIFLHLSLTNNWNPRPLLENNATGITIEGRDVTPGTNNTLPRNTLSNDYGGMDVYVRQFGSGNLSTHDEFYTNSDIQNKFMNYTTQIVSRYKNSSAIFAWEIANDPRCNSSMSASPNCNTNVITMFHANVSKHIQSVDPNHLVASGNQGFLCMDCKKLFPRQLPPQPSAKPVGRRSTIAKPLTKRKLLDDRKAAFKKTRALAQKTKPATTTGGVRIRGRWMSTETKRQSSDTQDVGPAFDGSSGVDSEDIINIPSIGFGSFQLFPDQNSYGLDDPNLPAFNNTVNQGLAWIQTHAALGALFNKPVILNGFGLVTQNNSQAFVPFNSSEAPFAQDTGATQAPFGVTDQQRDDAYTQWLQAGLAAGLQGMLQYQWSQGNLTTAVGTAISPTSDGTGVSSDVTGTGVSPDDGYGIQGSDFNGAAGIIQTAAQAFGLDDPNP